MSMNEHIEWCDACVTGADEDGLPRALLVGDSIAQSYFPRVEKDLSGKFLCARLATSKCVCDPAFQRELELVVTGYDFSVVHFNNGLHGWAYDEVSYERHLPLAFDLIARLAPSSRTIWASTTPVRKWHSLHDLDPKTERVRHRNRIADACAASRGIPVNDLYALVVDHPEYFSEDGTHFNSDGLTVVGRRVAESIATRRTSSPAALR